MRIKRENLYQHLLEKNCNMAEKTMLDALLCEDQKTWEVSRETFEGFEKYSIALIKKTLKINTNKARGVFDWFYEQHGLRIKD